MAVPRAADSISRRISLVHIATLLTLAVAQPLYYLLGRAEHAPFLIAHQSRAIDIWLFVACLSVALPAGFWLGLRLLGGLAPRLAGFCYALLLLGLWIAFFLPLVERLLGQASFVGVAIAGASAVAASACCRWVGSARTFLTFFSPLILLSPLLFLTAASVRSHLTWHETSDSLLFVGTRDLPNIVMIVFDELPLVSLLDENREIDAVRFPNFRRLADGATWYRNATSIDCATSGAVTGLLVGGEREGYLRNVHPSGMASSGPIDRTRFPRNLFSLLENDYQTFAVELTTKLAQNSEAAAEYVPGLPERMRELFEDASVLYAHTVVPEPFRHRLPVMEGQWRGFLQAAPAATSSFEWPYAESHGRIAGFRQLIDSLQPRNVPSFYFLHTLLPHFPFVFNERGQLHSNKFSFLTMHLREATGSNDWPDETTARLVYQAHLLQLGFTDRLLGSVLDRLVELELFDDALVIVTADHGTNFYWDSAGLSREEMVEVQASGTMYIPWLMKLPGQTVAEISDVSVQSIDILPTIADILELEVPWETEGASALDTSRPPPSRYAYLPKRIEFDEVVDTDRRALKYKLKLFGSNDVDGLYRSGPHRELLSQPVASFSSNTGSATLSLVRPSLYRGVDPDAPRLPAYVEGRIQDLPAGIDPSGPTIVLAVNGVIRNTVRSTGSAISSLRPRGPRDPGPGDGEPQAGSEARDVVHFLVRVPPKGLSKGENAVKIYAVVEDHQGRVASLMEIPEKP